MTCCSDLSVELIDLLYTFIMGANQSAEAQGQAQVPKEQVISAPPQDQSTSVQVRSSTVQKRPTDLQFSPTLINRLSSPSSKSDDSSKPSSNDDIVRRRLATESAHLRTQEAEILQAISSALEKENLDKEKPGMSSEVLGRDIEEVREKIERIKRDRLGDVGKGVQSAQEGVRKCYRSVV
jgi:altered-inheritance-of-mitochondria protein 13